MGLILHRNLQLAMKMTDPVFMSPLLKMLVMIERVLFPVRNANCQIKYLVPTQVKTLSKDQVMTLWMKLITIM